MREGSHTGWMELGGSVPRVGKGWAGGGRAAERQERRNCSMCTRKTHCDRCTTADWAPPSPVSHPHWAPSEHYRSNQGWPLV